ncbi:MAG: peptidoglycan-associated lipoprotein Pal [Rickettsiales bacterium]|jgi:peptidoglycan-associated lipoprotein|nr:peptidoglycan-associated lipoprotein Pal [Rickettsiales bacterium]
MKKVLSIAVTAMLLSACGGDLKLPDPIDGITPGTQKDFTARAGDKVFFDFDRSDIRSHDEKTLKLQALWLNTYKDTNLKIEGHCDERGTREYNQALGARRATSVKKFLENEGVKSTRLSTISYGKERPEVLGDTEKAWSQNRRAVSVVK